MRFKCKQGGLDPITSKRELNLIYKLDVGVGFEIHSNAYFWLHLWFSSYALSLLQGEQGWLLKLSS